MASGMSFSTGRALTGVTYAVNYISFLHVEVGWHLVVLEPVSIVDEPWLILLMEVTHESALGPPSRQ